MQLYTAAALLTVAHLTHIFTQFCGMWLLSCALNRPNYWREYVTTVHTAQIALSGFRLHFDHSHCGGTRRKPLPPTEFQNPGTVTTLITGQ